NGMYDLLLKGGRVYDGSGLPSYKADVAVVNGKIAGIGRLDGGDVDGLAVAPGFIDPHTHLDAQLLWDPLGTSSCYHGVTSVIVGNCGLAWLRPRWRTATRDQEFRPRSKRSAGVSLKRAFSGGGLPRVNTSTRSVRSLASMPPPNRSMCRTCRAMKPG
ncbi:MAG: amidohydrolase family protein, partial [Candidatus Binatia bacterium]